MFEDSFQQGTTDGMQLPISKEELRKRKNRVAAQESRDRKKEQTQKLQLEIEILRQEIEKQKLYIEYLEEKLQFYDHSTVKQEFRITNQQIAKYGLFTILSLMAIISIQPQTTQFLMNNRLIDVAFLNCTTSESYCDQVVNRFTNYHDVFQVHQNMPLIREKGVSRENGVRIHRNSIPFTDSSVWMSLMDPLSIN